MKDYNFIISDDMLHKTRFCKKGKANQNFPHKEGGWSKREGLKKEGVDVFKGGAHTLVPTMTQYKKSTEVANAHVQSKMSLFQSVQAVDTMGTIREMNRYLRVTLDKLQDTRTDLVRNDGNWQDW